MTPSKNTPEVGQTPALEPSRRGRSTNPDPKNSSELRETELEMQALLLERRAAYDKMKNGNMPLSTDELTRLMEVDYQRGLEKNADGMSIPELGNEADDDYLYRTEPKYKFHPGHDGFRGSGFTLEESPEPKFDNPHIKHMVRGHSDPYYSWEINYNVVGQWLRISGHSRLEAERYLKAWLAVWPDKWETLHLDRQTWFWAGYDYADARQKGWHPARHPPADKPANEGSVTPPPAPHP